jgi:hypothetical protein
MLNPTTHAETNEKFAFQNELTALLKKHHICKELFNTRPSIIGDLVVDFLENLKASSNSRSEGIVSFFINKQQMDDALERADRKDDSLYSPSTELCDVAQS